MVPQDGRLHYPAEPLDAHPTPEAVIGPYLYALGPDGKGRSDVVLRRLEATRARS
jgi:hypothetical protein